MSACHLPLFVAHALLAIMSLTSAYEVRPQHWHLKAARKQAATRYAEKHVQSEIIFPASSAMRGNRSFLQNNSTYFLEESMLLESVQYYAMLAYVIPSAVLFLWMVVFRKMSGIEDKLKERDAAMAEWKGTYDNLVNDLQECLVKTVDSEVDLIEQGFNGMARDFRNEMRHMSGSSELSKDELVAPLKTFVLQWLSAFNDWLLDPSEDPPPVVTKAELDSCGSVSEISALIVDKLHGYKVDLTTSDGNEVQRLIDDDPPPALACSWVQCCGLNAGYFFMQKPGEGGWPRSFGLSCIGITLFSVKHALLLGAFLLGPLVTLFEYGTGGTWGWLYGAYICGAWLCLLVILYLFEKIDDLARVEVEIEDLKRKNSEIVTFHAELKKKYDKITRYNNLWECRSLPCLRILKNMIAHVHYSPEHAVDLLKAANDGFTALDQQLGSKEFWYGSDAPSHEQLKLVEKLLEIHKDFIADKSPTEVLKVASNIFYPFTMISVRVDGCHDLHRGSMMDKSDPYVRVRLGNTAWKRTETRTNQLNPTWNSNNKFDFFAKIDDMNVEIQVKDDDYGEDTHLGHADLSFRDVEHGQCLLKTVTLQGVDQGEVAVALHHTVDMKAFLETPIEILQQVCNGEIPN